MFRNSFLLFYAFWGHRRKKEEGRKKEKGRECSEVK